MLIKGLLEQAQGEPFSNATRPAASSFPYRIIWNTDLNVLQISDGTTWFSMGSTGPTNRLAALWNVVFGSSAQVISGAATHSAFSAWTQADGDSVYILPGYTESTNWSLTKRVSICGQGYDSTVTGTFTLATGAGKSTVKGIRVTGNITINSGVTAVVFGEGCYQPDTATVTDNGSTTLPVNFVAGIMQY